jgi:hypothetical protein
MRVLAGIMFVVIVGLLILFYGAHKDDAILKAECERAGGVFIEAREPVHVCVGRVGAGK